MLQMIEANWLAFIVALLLGILVAWWIFARGSKGVERRERKPDVLDEGSAPAQRNQALIDAPPAVGLTPSAGAGTMAGVAEVIAVAAQDEVNAASEAAAESSAPAPVSSTEAGTGAGAAVPVGDDLGRMKGVGPKLVALLGTLGVTRFDQIANWSEEDIDRFDAQLGNFKGRIRRDNWVEQARYLSVGDNDGYEGKFGKL